MGVRIHHEGRAQDDGYRSALAPGLRARADARRLAEEIAFSSGRLLALAAQPPGLYGEIAALAGSDIERATWMCVLTAYLCPTEPPEPFAGIRMALERVPSLAALDGLRGSDGLRASDGDGEGSLDLADLPLGPRSSHDPTRGLGTLLAYRQWVQRNSNSTSIAVAAAPGEHSQASAFTGDPAWSPQRRFERLFERLALPGLVRMGRYELLVTLGRLGLYELQPHSLHLGGARGLSAEDQTAVGAKRLFAIGDPLLLERRAAALAEAIAVPLEALDLALSNWIAPQRASIGVALETLDDGALERAAAALEL